MGRADFDRDALAYDRVADAYERARPGYPAVVADRVVEVIDRRPHPLVVDLASGTGKFTRELLARGVDAVAVEPVGAMAEQCRRTTGARTVRALAGALPFRSERVDALTVAQAFQWLSARDVDEIARVLRPGAPLMIVANRRSPRGLWAEVNAVLDEERTTPRRTNDATSMLAESGSFGPVTHERTPWTRRVPPVTLRDHVSSMSWVAAASADIRARIDRRIAELVGSADELELPYETELVFALRT